MVKVKSHLDVIDAIQCHVLLKDLAGNAMVDSIAKAAAARAHIGEKVAEGVN